MLDIDGLIDARVQAHERMSRAEAAHELATIELKAAQDAVRDTHNALNSAVTIEIDDRLKAIFDQSRALDAND